ncbi:Toll/interleukin-1 receptor domain-containing protein [Tanacetum coccineum]
MLLHLGCLEELVKIMNARRWTSNCYPVFYDVEHSRYANKTGQLVFHLKNIKRKTMQEMERGFERKHLIWLGFELTSIANGDMVDGGAGKKLWKSYYCRYPFSSKDQNIEVSSVRVSVGKKYDAKDGCVVESTVAHRVSYDSECEFVSEAKAGCLFSRYAFEERIRFKGYRSNKMSKLFSPGGFNAEIAIKGLAKMKDLRFLDIDTFMIHYDFDDEVSPFLPCLNRKFDKVIQYLPTSLRFMRWHDFPFSSLPSTFQGKCLVELDIYCGHIVQLWEDGEEKVLNNLRFLTIRYSMLRTFDIRLAPNLEKLTISECFDFEELHIPDDHHSKLEYLNLTHSKLTNLHLGNAPNLKTLKFGVSHLTNLHLRNSPNLKTLHMSQCGELVEFQMPSESSKLEHLNLSHSKLTNLDLGNSPNLKTLDLNLCSRLVDLQMPSESLKLEYLDLSFSKLTNLHLGNTPNLQTLYLTCSKLTNLHLGNNLNLKTLILYDCNDLVEFQMPAQSLKLEHLDLSYSKLKTIHLGSTPNLERLILRGCENLVLPLELGHVKCLKELNIEYTGIRRLKQSILQLKGLRIIGSTEILKSCGLNSKIQTSGKETFCYI